MEKSKTQHQQRPSSSSSCYECNRGEEYAVVLCSAGTIAWHFLDIKKYNCDDSTPLESTDNTGAKINKGGTSAKTIALTKVQTNLVTNAKSKKLKIAKTGLVRAL